MDNLIGILYGNEYVSSFSISFTEPEILTIKFKDGSTLRLCEVQPDKTGKNNETTNIWRYLTIFNSRMLFKTYIYSSQTWDEYYGCSRLTASNWWPK